MPRHRQKKIELDVSKIIDPSKSLNEGAILFPVFSVGSWYLKTYTLSGLFDNDKKLADYSDQERELLLYGKGDWIIDLGPEGGSRGGQVIFEGTPRQMLDAAHSITYVKTFFMFTALFMIFAAPVAFLTPLQVARSFGDEYWRLTAIEMTFSVGMTAGGILMAFWGGFKNKIHTMVLSNLTIGICTFALGVIPVFWLYLIVMGMIGIAMPVFHTPSNVLLQQKVDGNYIGRVYGVYGMLASSMMPLGMLVFGPIADIVPIEWLLLGTGALLFVQGFAMLGSRVLIEAGKPAAAAE